MITPAAGDVLAVVQPSLFGKVIQVFERLQGKSDISNHVVIISGQDALGRWIGVQGKPTGVGMVEISIYLNDSRTRSNHDQLRPDDTGQLATMLASLAKSLHIGYDWVGIAEDALSALTLFDLSGALAPLWAWPDPDGGTLPGHVVCSSLASWLYESVEWAHPDEGADRTVEPADWWNWSDKQLWITAAPKSLWRSLWRSLRSSGGTAS
jgi:hypothetical protein